MEENSTNSRLRTWGKILLRPQSWPLEMLFAYALYTISLVAGGSPVTEAMDIAWLALLNFVTSPLALLMIVIGAPIMFVRGVNQVVRAEASGGLVRSTKWQQELDQTKRLVEEASGLSGMIAAHKMFTEHSDLVGKRINEATDAIPGFETQIDATEALLNEPNEFQPGLPHNRKGRSLDTLRDVRIRLSHAVGDAKSASGEGHNLGISAPPIISEGADPALLAQFFQANRIFRDECVVELARLRGKLAEKAVLNRELEEKIRQKVQSYGQQ